MQVKPEELGSHLSGPLRSVYLVSGDETLIVEESCDAVIRAAHGAGYTERSIHHGDAGFKWHDLSNDSASISLFAEKKIIDVRLTAKRFDREASDTLRDWLDNQQSDDTILLLRCGRLEPRQRNSAWFKAIDQAGVICLVWPLSARALPGWLAGRCRQVGLACERDALQYLAERVEGNLLAARQEIDKITMLDLPAPVTLEDMIACLEDASRFSTFDLLDAMMAGDAERVVRISAALREEKVSVFAILGALTSQIRRGSNTRGLPPGRARLLQGFAERIRDPRAILTECAVIDQQGKGQVRGDAWISLEKLLLRLAGKREIRLASEDLRDAGMLI